MPWNVGCVVASESVCETTWAAVGLGETGPCVLCIKRLAASHFVVASPDGSVAQDRAATSEWTPREGERDKDADARVVDTLTDRLPVAPQAKYSTRAGYVSETFNI